MARYRGASEKNMTMRCHEMSHGAARLRTRRERHTQDGRKPSSRGFLVNCVRSLSEYPLSVPLNVYSRYNHLSGGSWPTLPRLVAHV